MRHGIPIRDVDARASRDPHSSEVGAAGPGLGLVRLVIVDLLHAKRAVHVDEEVELRVEHDEGTATATPSIVTRSEICLHAHDVLPFSPANRCFARIVARTSDHLVLGAQPVGAGVSEFTLSLRLATKMGAVLEDIPGTVGAHPTRSEAIHEAVPGALGRGLHF